MHKIQEPLHRPDHEKRQAAGNCRCGCNCSSFQMDGRTMMAADFISSSSGTLLHAHYKSEEG